MNPKELMELAVKALDSKKAQDIEVLELTDVSNIGDYFVIATATSSTAIKALADEVEKKTSEAGAAPRHIEGYNSAIWILLDYGDIVVHIFNKESRGFYSLERLWADAKRYDISHIIV